MLCQTTIRENVEGQILNTMGANVKDEILTRCRGRSWSLGGGLFQLEGDNQAFPVENNNKDKKSTELIGYCILVCCFICTQY